MAIYLLLATVVIMACVFFNKITGKLGVPMLLAFILLGMFFGIDGVVKIPFENYKFAEQICSVALIFIMFYGGFGTKWSEAKPVAVKAILLSSIGVMLTAGFTGLFCYYILKIPFLESFLIGSVISSTDAASVFSILRSKSLNLKYNTASLLEVESGSNDPFSYMLTVIVLSIMKGSADGGNILIMIVAQVVIALIFGAVISYLALIVLKKFQFYSDGFDAIFVFAVGLLSYAAPSALGGNGYLSAYIVGIVLGNKPIKNKKSLVNFFDGTTGLMQMLIFFLLGLLATPSQLPKVIGEAFAVALFLTFMARPLAVFMLMTPFRSKLKQQLFVAWSGLRGAASIVFAIMATISNEHLGKDIYHFVFFIVLFSILIQGTLIPIIARRLDMIDDDGNVFKTFNDYTEEVPIQFIQFAIKETHPWAGKKIREVTLPPDTLLVLVKRNNKNIFPYGDTLILPGDVFVLSAKVMAQIEDIKLFEMSINKNHGWIGKRIDELSIDPGKLIIMIQRGSKIVIPSGKTMIKDGDVLVINQNMMENRIND